MENIQGPGYTRGIGRKKMNSLSKALAAALALSCLTFACSLQDSGSTDLEIILGPAASADAAASRDLDTGWTGGALPAFSSVTVTVSARDMRRVTQTIGSGERSIRLRVPCGQDRLVEIEAVPASGFVSSYYGSQTTDVDRGAVVKLAIGIGVSETGILLPDAIGDALYDAAGISGLRSQTGLPKSIDEDDDFEFDDRGRVYMASSLGLDRLGSLSSRNREGLALAYPVSKGIAYDPGNFRVHYISDLAGLNEICYVDISQAVPAAVLVSRLSETQRWGPALAAGAGNLYATSYSQVQAPTDLRIVRLSLSGGANGTASYAEAASVSYEDLGLAVPGPNSSTRYLVVEDMLLKDGVLFVLASDVYEGLQLPPGGASGYYSRGKMLALSAESLGKLWETGWCGDENQFPRNSGTEFYGPRRIVGIMPRKLFVADDGFSLEGPSYNRFQSDRDRVFGVDTGTGSIEEMGLQNEVPFFRDFSYANIC